jgi:hypothetical protein
MKIHPVEAACVDVRWTDIMQLICFAQFCECAKKNYLNPDFSEFLDN